MPSSSQQSRERALRRLLRRTDAQLARSHRLSTTLTWWRLAIFLTGAACTVFPYRLGWYHTGNAALALFFVIFLVVARYHNRLEAAMHRLRLWRRLKQTQLARLLLEWEQLPDAPPLPLDGRLDSHPYARDLDIVGPYSLLRLLDTTISSAGRERLAAWLLGTAIEASPRSGTQPPGRWPEQQRLVREVATLPLFRDRLQLVAALVSERPIDATRIRQLLAAPVGFPLLRPVLVTEAVLAVITLALVLASLLGGLPDYWSLSLTLYVALYLLTVGQTSRVFPRAMALHHELDKLGRVFGHLERRSYRATPALATLCAPIVSGRLRPSSALHRLARVTQALSIRAHPLVHLAANALVPWDLYFSDRLERLRARTETELPRWLEALAELEAAAALGNLAYLNPDYVWPTRLTPSVTGNGHGATFKARALGHPLLPTRTRVVNDVELHGLGRILLLTGSNMSGKSTFLRTVGINVCLAQAGGPVCAAAFEWTWVRLTCCIRVDDSLEAGLSFFYAEVKRLKRLLDAAGERAGPPVLFLIDEIFKGTNNRERLLGSAAFIRTLAGSNGFGLITTHDLELAELEREIPSASNAHFQETVEGNELRFDYRLRPGPCPTTNALRIMALEGLPVPGPGSPTGPM